MNPLLSITRLESISFQRFLRRNVIAQAVVAGRVLLAILSVTFIALLAHDIYQSNYVVGRELSNFSLRLVEQPTTIGQRRPKPEQNFGVIAQRAMFGPLGQSAVNSTKTAPRPISSTQFALIGTFVGAAQENFAIIEEQKRKSQDVFLLNDSVFGEARLTGIFHDRVEIDRNGQTEILTIDSAPDSSPPVEGGVAHLDADEYAVEEAELDKALENLPLLLTQARAVPFFKEGRAVGLRLFAIRAGSLFEKIGLQNGDVLKAVNGNSLADLSQAMQLFQKLKEERTISVVLERNSVERQFRYEIR